MELLGHALLSVSARVGAAFLDEGAPAGEQQQAVQGRLDALVGGGFSALAAAALAVAACSGPQGGGLKDTLAQAEAAALKAARSVAAGERVVLG